MNDQPIREIKPVIVPAQFFVAGPIRAGLLALGAAMLVGLIVALATLSVGINGDLTVRSWGLVFTFGGATYALAFTAGMVLIGLWVFKEPGQTTYTIFPDHVECCEGLWVRSRRTLPFDQVIGAELTEGTLQRTRGAGTVILVTRGTGGKADQQEPATGGESRVVLGNVPHARDVYALIRWLVLNTSRAGPGAAADRPRD